MMHGKTSLSLKAWKAERDKLNADMRRLNGEYASLKTETAEVEKIRSHVYATRKQDMEL